MKMFAKTFAQKIFFMTRPKNSQIVLWPYFFFRKIYAINDNLLNVMN